jgi:hypothetical protein
MSSLSTVVWSLDLKNPPASLAAVLKQQQLSQSQTAVPEDVAFVALVSYLSDNDVTLKQIADVQDLTLVPTFPAAIAPFVEVLRSAEFQKLFKEYSDLIGAGYPDIDIKECNEDLTSSSELKSFRMHAVDKNDGYYRDPVFSVSPVHLNRWGALLQWPMNSLLHKALNDSDNALACSLTEKILTDLLQEVIQFAAKEKRPKPDTLYTKCRVPAMQLLLSYFGFRVYANEPRVLTFARLVEYFTPCSTVGQNDLIYYDEIWTDKITELNAKGAQFTADRLIDIPGAWVRYRKMITCTVKGGTGCPMEKDIDRTVSVSPQPAASAAASASVPAAAPSPASAPAPELDACTRLNLSNLKFDLAGVTRYDICANQQLLDTALDKGLVIPLKLFKVSERNVRNFALAFNLGSMHMPIAAVTSRVVEFLESFIKNPHFLTWWLLTKGYILPENPNADQMYRAYILHHVCEQGQIGNSCDLSDVFTRAEKLPDTQTQTQSQRAEVKANTVLFQIPDSGLWRKLESSSNSDTVLVFQAIGQPDTVPSSAAFSLVAQVKGTPFEELIDKLAKERYAVYSGAKKRDAA